MGAADATDELEVARAILAAIPDALLVTDLAGEVLVANRSARRLLTGDDAGDPPPVARWTTDRERATEVLRGWASSSTPRPATLQLASGRTVRGDGARLAGGRVLIRLQDRDRSLTAYTSVSTQLRSDHLRALSQRLDATVAELHTANRQLSYANEELQQYAAAVAHDVRTPLFTIRGFAQMLEHHANLDDEGRELVRLILASAERLHQTTESLLAVARLDQSAGDGGDAAIEVLHVLHQTLDDLSGDLAATRAEVDADGVAGVKVAVPPVALRQVLQNLVSNSLRFRDPSRPPRIVITANITGDLVEVAVSDNGVGVADSEREHLFDLFQRGTRRVETPGHGIGLATCRKLVNRWGGSIRCEPTTAEGARFVFTAPRVPAAAPAGLD